MVPLFSGGHDSYCACFCASQHRKFKGQVFHIDTGIGALRTRQFVEEVCVDEGWQLRVYRSKNSSDSYEAIVRKGGFPLPALHGLCYHRLKQSSVLTMTRVRKVTMRGASWVLITGARQQESKRRMGHTEAIRVGNAKAKGDSTKEESDQRVWVNPCFDWSSEEQRDFMNSYRLERNPIKESPLSKSGECFCGCFARPCELELIREHCPDVGKEIDRLVEIARSLGHRDTWGNTDRLKSKVSLLPTGPLCSSCDYNAKAAGIEIVGLDEGGFPSENL